MTEDQESAMSLAKSLDHIDPVSLHLLSRLGSGATISCGSLIQRFEEVSLLDVHVAVADSVPPGTCGLEW